MSVYGSHLCERPQTTARLLPTIWIPRKRNLTLSAGPGRQNTGSSDPNVEAALNLRIVPALIVLTLAKSVGVGQPQKSNKTRSSGLRLPVIASRDHNAIYSKRIANADSLAFFFSDSRFFLPFFRPGVWAGTGCFPGVLLDRVFRS